MKRKYVVAATAVLLVPVIIVAVVAALIWNYPPAMRYTAYYPDGIILRGIGEGYFGSAYGDFSLGTSQTYVEQSGETARYPLDLELPVTVHLCGQLHSG